MYIKNILEVMHLQDYFNLHNILKNSKALLNLLPALW